MNVYDKIKGSVVGLVIGDALGAPIECLRREDIVKKYGFVADYLDMSREFNPKSVLPDGDYRLRGVHTDDSQLALILLESLIRDNGFMPERYANDLVNYYTILRGIGKSTREAIEILRSGGSWRKSGNYTRPGNGAAMKIAPLGIFYRHDLAVLKEKSIESAVITHKHPDSIAAAVAVAFTVAYVINRESFDVNVYVKETADFISDINFNFGNKLENLITLLDVDTKDALRTIGTRSVSQESVIAALYLFLKYNNDFYSAVTQAINAGGDTDTVGCIIGALVGARVGYSNIPRNWIDGLRIRDDVEERADALAKNQRIIFKRRLEDIERGLTIEERTARKEIKTEFFKRK